MQALNRIIGFALLVAAMACGSSTAPAATRYNFAVIAGKNQVVTAQAAAPQATVTSMLTRDPNGTFASRVMDFLAPAVAYAQEVLSIPGVPIANQIVCGQQAKPGEPEIVPLCAFTLADGKAANKVVGKTKAGVYTLPFTAQIASQAPVKDSTVFTVLAGPAVTGSGGSCNSGQPGCYLVNAGDVFDLHITLTKAWDEFSNPVDISAVVPSYAIRGPCGDGQPNCTVNPSGLVADGTGWTFTIDKKWAGQKVFLYVILGSKAIVTWPLEVK